MFYHLKNVLHTELLCDVQPQDYKMEIIVPPEVREDKLLRQEWYKKPEMLHYFYTGIEPQVPARRPSDKNPPFRIHAFIADYDKLKLPKDQVMRAVEGMPVRPTYVEASLGGNWRLIWDLEVPLLVGGEPKFSTYLLQAASKWLNVDALPECDVAAFTTFSRLYCHGGTWEKVGEKIPDDTTQAFLVRCATKYDRFSSSPEEANIPLEDVEKALREKFPKLNWPGPFELGSQGPSFWVAGSESPKSAIVHPNGMYTFSAHAVQTFYSWGHPDLLGPEFVKTNLDARLAKATRNVFAASEEKYYRMNPDTHALTPYTHRELNTYFKVVCGLSAVAAKGEKGSQTEAAFSFLKEHQSVAGVGPFCFTKPGLIIKHGRRFLNTYDRKPLEPATGTQKWGGHGEFPFMSLVMDELLALNPHQVPVIVAWGGYLFNVALNWHPQPGPSVLFAGGPSTGKTLVNRHFFGDSVGGFADGRQLLIRGSNFTSMEFEAPYIVLDDDAIANSLEDEHRVTAAVKKLVGNQEARYEKKFHNGVMIDYNGRLGITLNLDHRSTRFIGSFDGFLLDKVHLIRCVEQHSKLVFPSRDETIKLVEKERPYFMRYCMDFVPPDSVVRDSRWGYATFHDPSLKSETHQSSRVAPFKELLVRALAGYFESNSEQEAYEGSQTDIYNLLKLSDTGLLRNLRDTQLNSNLEQIHKEKLLPCSHSTGDFNTRVWRFAKFRSLVQGTRIDLSSNSEAAHNFAKKP